MKTLDKSLLVLAALAESTNASLTELATKVCIDKVIVYRILKTFIAHRYVARDAKTLRYRIGSAPLELALQFVKTNPPHVLVAPRLVALRDATGETVHFTTVQDTYVELVSVTASPARVRVAGEIGETAPLHCTASGKIFLALADSALFQRVFATPPEALTQRTITEASAMQRELEQIRQRGYAVDDEEFSVGARAAAAPVFAQANHCVGCITVVAPSSRLTQAKLTDLARQVVATAAQCSADIQAGTTFSGGSG